LERNSIRTVRWTENERVSVATILCCTYTLAPSGSQVHPNFGNSACPTEFSSVIHPTFV